MSTLLMLQSAAHDVHTAVQSVQHVLPLADPPKPGGYNGPAVGNGTPPGGDKLSLVLGWMKYIFYGIAVLGIFVTGADMAISRNRHGASNHAQAFGAIAIACALVGAATQIVGLLVG